MKSWNIIIKITFKKNQFETPKDTHLKMAIKLRTMKYGVLSDSDESVAKGCNNDDDELSNDVTTSILSRQVHLGNNDIKKDQHKHKSKTKKRNEKGLSVTVVVGDSKVKKKVGSYLAKMIYLLQDLFQVQRQMIWNRILSPHLKTSPNVS